MIDYFNTLGVSPDASMDEVQDAFRKISREYHPDITEHPKDMALEKMKDASAAYSELRAMFKNDDIDVYRYDLRKWYEKHPEEAMPTGPSDQTQKHEPTPTPPQGASYTDEPASQAEPTTSSYETETTEYVELPQPVGGQAAGAPPQSSPSGAKGAPGAGATQSIASKAIGKKVAGKAAAAVAGKAAGTALGTVAGSILPVIGNLLGAIVGDFVVKGLTKVGREVGKSIGLIPLMIMSAFSSTAAVLASAISATLSFTVIGLALFAGLVAIILFIINSGAYIVPKSDSLSAGGTVVEASLCFNFVNFPPEGIQLEIEASNIIGRAENFVSEICQGGDITVTYLPQPAEGQDCAACGGRVIAYKQIQIFPRGLGSLGNTLYTLAHELGHIHQYTSTSDSLYYQSNALRTEGPVCTYPLDTDRIRPGKQISPSESYPEMITLFIGAANPLPGFVTTRNNCLGGSFQQAMPLTWQFARDFIFKETLDW